jgi:hypothetical protein
MHNEDVLHAWFIFNLHTKISYVFTRHGSWYLHNVTSNLSSKSRASMKNPRFTYLEGQFLVCGNVFPCTLVPSLVTTAPPLGFYHFHPFLTIQFTLHYLHRRHQQSRSSSSGTVRISSMYFQAVMSALCYSRCYIHTGLCTVISSLLNSCLEQVLMQYVPSSLMRYVCYSIPSCLNTVCSMFHAAS